VQALFLAVSKAVSVKRRAYAFSWIRGGERREKRSAEELRMRTGRMSFRGILVRTVLPIAAVCVVISAWAASSDSASRLQPSFGEEAILDTHQPRGSITNIFGTTGSDSNPSVAAGFDGLWIAVWHTSDPMGGSVGLDWDIFISRSTDGGETWEEGALLNSNGADDRGDDLSPAIATDGEGNWIVAWASTESFDGIFGGDRDILFCSSTDNGKTWSAPAPLNVNAAQDYGNDWAVTIDSDADGRWVAAWSSSDSLGDRIGGDSDIFVSRSRDNGSTWSYPAPLNANAVYDTGFDTSPFVASDGEDLWLTVWSSGESFGGRLGIERDILVSRSTDGGASWSDPAPLNQNAETDDSSDWSPRIATNGKGVWVAVWSSADTLGGSIGFDSDMLLARSDDNGVTWSRPIPVDPHAELDAQEDASPSIVTDGEGNWMAAWHSFSNSFGYGHSDSDVVVTFSQDEGRTWSGPKAINREAGDDDVDDSHPRLATDRRGNWVVIWQTFAVSGGTTVTDEVRSGWTVSSSHGRLVESAGGK
jgi:Neuraminidase (sialidase)